MENNKKILINFSFFFIFFIMIFFISYNNVFAETKTGIGFLNNSSVIISDNRGNDIQLPRLTTNSQNITIRNIIFQSNYNFQKDIVYEYEIELANQYIDDISSIYLRGGNTICSFISLEGLNNSYLKVRFTCPSNVSYITIGLSNLGGSAITDSYNIQWKNIYLWQINDAIDLGPIINGQNQNTQDIINNNDTNTNKIIEENNKNFNSCRDSYNLFNPNNVENGYVSDNTGSLGGVNNSNKNTGYIEIKPNTKYYILSSKSDGNWGSFYDSNKTYISGIKQSLFSNGKTIIQSPSNAKYLRFTVSYNNNNNDYANNVMIAESSSELQYEPYGEEICTNKLDEQTNAINGLNDSLNDDDTNGATSEASDFFSDFNTNTFGLTSIITAPLNLIQSLTNKTCTPLHLPLPYLSNKYLDLPCMSTIYSEHFGTFFTLYQTITYGIIAYWVCVRIFNHVKDFKNPEHDEIEVVDL